MFWVTFEHNMMGNVSSFFTACSIVSQAAHRMVTINNLNIIVFEQHHKNSITHFVILYSNFPILFANRSSTSEREAASELEAQRIAGLSQSSLMVRLNSLAYMLDALAGHEATRVHDLPYAVEKCVDINGYTSIKVCKWLSA